MKLRNYLVVAALLLCNSGYSLTASEAPKKKVKEEKVFPGADEKTPSRTQYFSWINNTNEGATEANTLANLRFF